MTKTIKKITMLLFLIIASFSIFSTILYAISSTEQYDTTFIGNIICFDEDIDLSNIEIKVYESIPTFEDEDLTNFTERYSFSILTQSDGTFTFDKPTKHISLSINLDTLPTNYGISNKNIFIGESNTTILYLMQIEDIEIKYASDSLGVIMYGINDMRIYAPYSVNVVDEEISILNINEIDDVEYKIIVNVYDKKYEYSGSYDISNYSNDEKIEYLYNQGILNEDDIMSLSSIWLINEPSSRTSVSGGGFKVHYNNQTTDIDYVTDEAAQRVLDSIQAIDELFCDTYGFIKPYTFDITNIYHIYITNILDYYPDGGVQAFTQKLGINSNSYIAIDYRIASNNNFQAKLAHEYFHAILYKYHVSSSSRDYAWMHEAFSQAMSYIYCIEDEIEIEKIKGDYCDDFHQFMINPKYSIVMETNNEEDIMFNYRSYIFPYYLWHEYGIEIIIEIVTIAGYSGQNIMTIIDAVLQYNHNSSLKNEILNFNIYNAYPDYYYYWKRGYYIFDLFEYGGYLTGIYPVDLTSSIQENEVFKIALLRSEYLKFVKEDNDPTHMISIIIESDEYSDISLSLIRKNSQNAHNITSLDFSSQRITLLINNFGNSFNIDSTLVMTNITYQGIANISTDINIYNKDVHMGDNTITEDFDNNTSYLRFIPQTTDMYEFKVRVWNNTEITYPLVTLKILDANYQIIINHGTANALTMELTRGVVYYINVTYASPRTGIYLLIYNVTTEHTLSSSQYLNIKLAEKKGDNLVKIYIPQNNTYTIASFLDTNAVGANYKYLIYRKTPNDLILLDEYSIIRGQHTYTKNYSLNEGDILYIGSLNISSSIPKININIKTTTLSSYTLHMDPSWITDEEILGSDYLLNGKLHDKTTITVAYTRCIFLDSTAIETSRTKYIWISCNPDIARVSSYGTITGLKVGKTRIEAIYENDDKTIRIISYVDIEVVEDASITFKSINLSLVGIIPNSNNEIVVGVGYVGSIFIIGNAPTNSMQDYNWSTDDNTKATISIYGTLTIKNKTGVVRIRYENKYNSKVTGSIIITIQ